MKETSHLSIFCFLLALLIQIGNLAYAQESTLIDQESIFDEEEIPLEQPATDSSVIKHTMSFDMPLFGKFTLNGTIDLEQQIFKLEGKPSKSSYKLGVLEIQNPTITLSNTHGLAIDAQLFFLGKKVGKFAIESFNPATREMLFSFSPPEPLSISITPWKTITIASLYALLSPYENRVFTRFSLSKDQTDETEIAFGVEKTSTQTETESTDTQPATVQTNKDFFVEVIITNSNFGDLVDGSVFQKIVLVNGFVRITHPFSKEKLSTTHIQGEVDLSALKLQIPIKTEFFFIEGTINKELGTEFFVSLGGTIPVIPNVLSLWDPQLIFTKKPATTIPGPHK